MAQQKIQTNQIKDILISPLGGNNNILLGPNAGAVFGTGNGNVIIGALAGDEMTTGSNNVILGIRAGFEIEEGDNNILIGYQAGKTQTDDGSLDDSLVINNESIRDPNLYPPYLRGRMRGDNSTLQLGGSFFIKADKISPTEEGPTLFGFLNTGELELSGDPGVAGQVPTSNGPGQPLSWGEGGGGGGGSQPLNQIVFGTGPTTDVTSVPAFTFNPTSSTLSIVGTGDSVIEAGVSENLILNGLSVIVETNGIERFTVTNTGSYLVSGDPGAVGEVLTSAGPSEPAVWLPSSGGAQPNKQIVFGNSTGTGVTSDPDFTFDPTLTELKLAGASQITATTGQDLSISGNKIILKTGAGSTEKFAIGAAGDLLIGGTAAGTVGQVLKSGGPGAPPTWSAAVTEFTWNVQNNDYTIQPADANNGITADSVDPIVIRIPDELVVGVFPSGTRILISTDNIGDVVVTPDPYVTCLVRTPLTTTLAGQYSVVTLLRKGPNSWYLFGDLA